MGTPGKRIEVSNDTIKTALDRITKKLNQRLQIKGQYGYMSRHETLGIITEEFWELVQAVQGNKSDEYESELIDVAVGCLFGLASRLEQLKAEKE
jgi:hypothetical protein